MDAGIIQYLELGQLYLETLVSLVWPIAMIVVILLFRHPIATVIQNIRKVSGSGMEVEIQPRGQETAELLGETVDTVQRVAAEVLGEQTGDPQAAAKEIQRVVANNFLAIDIAPFLGQINERNLPIPYDANMTFADLQDRIWPTLIGRVEIFSYGLQWQLRFADTREVIVNQYHNQRIQTNQTGRAGLSDRRTLQELGISPGRRLIVEPLLARPRLIPVGGADHRLASRLPTDKYVRACGCARGP